MAVIVTTKTPVTEITMTTVLAGGEVAGDTGEFIPLVDHLMRSKFQQLNVSRQKITSVIKTGSILKPFQMYKDDKQANKPFILFPTRMSVLDDTYEIELVEYNNSDEINLT